MDRILNFDDQTLCSYLFGEFLSEEEDKLWEDGLKPLIMKGDLQMLEIMLIDLNLIKKINCRHCKLPLIWLLDNTIENDDENNNSNNNDDDDNNNIENEDNPRISINIKWLCLNCPIPEVILKCNIEKTCNLIIKLMAKENSQLIATTFNLILIGINKLNYITKPIIPDDPINIIEKMYKKKSNLFKLGSSQSLIIVDLYIDNYVENNYILYIADTVCIPTRYYFQVIKSLRNVKNDEDIDDESCEIFIKELMKIANKVINCDCLLLLGQTIQKFLKPHLYKKYKNNFKGIIDINTLLKLKNKTNESEKKIIKTNFNKIMTKGTKIISIVNIICSNNKNYTKNLINYKTSLQKLLIASIWLKTFSGTPYEIFINHIFKNNLY